MLVKCKECQQSQSELHWKCGCLKTLSTWTSLIGETDTTTTTTCGTHASFTRQGSDGCHYYSITADEGWTLE